MNPKSAGPFILDAHSFWIGSSVFSARGVNISGWSRTYAITASRFSLGVLGLPRTFLTQFRFMAMEFVLDILVFRYLSIIVLRLVFIPGVNSTQPTGVWEPFFLEVGMSSYCSGIRIPPAEHHPHLETVGDEHRDARAGDRASLAASVTELGFAELVVGIRI